MSVHELGSAEIPALLQTGRASPEISVIIVSWNARSFLQECLESLTSGVNRTCEIIVVDNASVDGSPEMVASKFPDALLIKSPENLGFSKGNNVGIDRSRGKYIALVNSDATTLPGCLDALADFLDENPDVGMVGPRVMYGDRRLQSSCRRFPGLWNNFCEGFYLNKLFPRSEFFAGEHMHYFAYDRTREVEVLVGCYLMTTRTAVEKFGLLDENFFFYGEDLDWSRRCRQAGLKVMFYPKAEVIHYCGGSSANDPARFAVAQLHARLQLWSKHKSRWAVQGLRLLLYVQCSFRLLAALLTRKNSGGDAAKNPLPASKVQVACLRALWGLQAKSP